MNRHSSENMIATMPRDFSKARGQAHRRWPKPGTDLFRPEKFGQALSPREFEIMELAAQGLSAKKIAARLGLRFYTVTTYMKHIYRKLGVHNRVSAIVRFHQTNCPQCGCDLKAGTRCTSAGSLADDFDL
jgi:DNA-binding NarL/FixJ family response regulator